MKLPASSFVKITIVILIRTIMTNIIITIATIIIIQIIFTITKFLTLQLLIKLFFQIK